MSDNKLPDRIWYNGTTRHARELRHEPPSSDIHPQHEYVRADTFPATATYNDGARAATLGMITDSNLSRFMNDYICCNGQDCGCQGATVQSYLEWCAEQTLIRPVPEPVASGRLFIS